MFPIALLSIAVGVSFSVGPSTPSLVTIHPSRPLLVADNSKDYDPGKEITDNPHGPNPHGPDPHGGDGHDEVHDKDMPANNPDRYLNRDQ